MHLPAVLVGIGLAGTLDEVVLHQLLNWHHFYSDGESAEMLTDGLFHVFATCALVVGLLLLWRRAARPDRTLWAGVLIGAGGFNVFDSVVDHKLLDLHQVREGEPTLVYDLVFTGIALAVLVAGIALLRRGARPAAPPTPR